MPLRGLEATMQSIRRSGGRACAIQSIAAVLFMAASVFAVPPGARAQPPNEQRINEDQFAPLLRFITIPAKDLPQGVRMLKGAGPRSPFLSARHSPAVMLDAPSLKFISAFFGIRSKTDLEPVIAAVTAMYHESAAADEIGVWGIYFVDQKSADKQFKKIVELTKERAKKRKSFPFVQKGRLLLYVWEDKAGSDPALESIAEYLRAKKLDLSNRP
jgi:hypothetical protein